jgi:hypothetical protein
VQDDLFSGVLVVDSWGSEVQLPALEEVRDFVEQRESMGSPTTPGRGEELSFDPLLFVLPVSTQFFLF